MNNPVRDFLLRLFLRWYQPRSPLTPWRWHEEKKTQLGAEESQEYAGPYDSSLAPQNRFFMEFAQGKFSDNIEFLPGFEDQDWRECVIKKSSQVGVTLSILLVITWWIDQVRKGILYAIDTIAEAQRISKARLQPLIRACAASADRIQAGGEGMNVLTLYLRDLVIYLTGGQSDTAFQNKSVTLGVVDEADSHPIPKPGLAHNVEDARARLKAVTDAKLYIIGKPKTEEHIIHKEHKTGTMHVCLVPLPALRSLPGTEMDAGSFRALQARGRNRIRSRARQGGDLLRMRRVRAADPRVPQARHDAPPQMAPDEPESAPEKNLRPHFGSVLAVSHVHLGNPCDRVHRRAQVDRRDDHLPPRPPGQGLAAPGRERAHAGRYREAALPESPLPSEDAPVPPVLHGHLLDVQLGVKKWVKGAFMPNGDLYIVDWGSTMSYDDLIDEANEPVPVGIPWDWPKSKPWEGETYICDQGGVDEGYETTEVRRFCMRSEDLFVPTKGRGDVTSRRIVVESEGEIDGEPIITYHFDDSDFKKQLYVKRISEVDKIIAGKSKFPRLYYPWELDAAMIDEMASEKLGTEIDRMGFTREKWEKDPNVPNDYGDGVKGCLVLGYWMLPQILAALAPEPPPQDLPAAA